MPETAGLDTIILDPYLFGSMYAGTLYEDRPVIVAQDQSGLHTHLGKNLRSILIVLSEEGDAIVAPQNLEFLLNILKACGINLNDAAIINTVNDDPENRISAVTQFQPAFIIFCGTAPDQHGIPLIIPSQRVLDFNGIKILTTGSLEALQGDTEQKKLLWQALKKMFSI